MDGQDGYGITDVGRHAHERVARNAVLHVFRVDEQMQDRDTEEHNCHRGQGVHTQRIAEDINNQATDETREDLDVTVHLHRHLEQCYHVNQDNTTQQLQMIEQQRLHDYCQDNPKYTIEECQGGKSVY